MLDGIGWLATALFASSYFCKQPAALRRLQGLAALVWAVYGALIHALPIIVANVIVASLAFGSSLWRRGYLPPSGTASPTSTTRSF